MAGKGRLSAVAAEAETSGSRACADCSAPNSDLGVITDASWGGLISGNCGAGGKWYARFTGEAGHVYHWDLCPNAPGNGSASQDVDIKICDVNCTILAGVDGSENCSPVTWVPNDFQWPCVAAGNYFVVIAPYRSYDRPSCGGTAATTFTLNYYKGLPCDVTCPSGALVEPEPCGQDTNGGCYSDPPVYTDVSCGQTYCGTTWAANGAYDTDWYRITTTEPTKITWTVTSEFLSANGLFSGDCSMLWLEASAQGGACQPVSMVRFLPAGTYILFIAPGYVSDGVLFDGYPCGQHNHYVFTVSCEPPQGYCETGNDCDQYISRVQLGTIDNSSDCNDDQGYTGYSDFTALSTDIPVGSTPRLLIVTDSRPNEWEFDFCAAWVDWDNSESFEGGEAIRMSASPGGGPFAGYVTVPTGTALGGHRLRIRLNPDFMPDACGYTDYGEVEDYTINVIEAPATGACCSGFDCTPEMSREDCLAQGSMFQGGGSTCSPLSACVGACCLPDGSCMDVPGAAQCAGAFVPGVTCATSACPPLNDECETAMAVGDVVNLPFDTTHATTSGIGGVDFPNFDIFYCYTAWTTGRVVFDTCGTTFDTGMAIWDGCACPPTNLLAFNDDAGPACGGPTASIGMNCVAGHRYLVQVGGFALGRGVGDLTISPVTPCTISCTPNEGEPPCGPGYVDTYNGGCDSTPHVFQPIVCGQTICGQSGTYVTNWSHADSDWFELVTTEPKTLTVSIVAEFPVLLYVRGAAGGCPGTWIEYVHPPRCTPASATTPCLEPGTYWIKVVPLEAGGVPCGAKYQLTMNCAPCVGACCRGTACTQEVREACVSGGGCWHQDTPCTPSPCTGVDFVVAGPYPYSTLGNTCGAGNNCPLRASEEQIYEVHIPSAGMWAFALQGTTWTPSLYLGNCPCLGDIASSNGSIQANLGAGVYYLTIEGFGSTDCGSYGLRIAPCSFECPPAGIPENEPPCGPDYGDGYNGGCSWTPPHFERIGCGATICGKSGTYLYGTDYLRDTDWFEYVAKDTRIYTWTVRADFPVLIFVFDGTYGCDQAAQIGLAYGPACIDASVTTAMLPAGTYWFVVTPNTFNDIPCESDYVATLTCQEVPGACCLADGCLNDQTRSACEQAGGHWLGVGSQCSSNDCNSNGIPDECDLSFHPEWDCNHNQVIDSCDIASGTSQDCNHNGVPDECESWGTGPNVFQWDDGVSENNLGISDGAEICWIHSFVAAHPATIQAILTDFGTPAFPGTSGVHPGDTFRVYVWGDPTDDGDPTDAVLLAQATGTAAAGSIDTDVLQSVPIAANIPAGSFFVGASIVHAAGFYPAPMDETTPQHHAWGAYTLLPPFNPSNLPGMNLASLDALGFPANWMLRVQLSYDVPPNDCNTNGIPDACDIAADTSRDCNSNGVPDECDIARGTSQDINSNGIPDECESGACCFADGHCEVKMAAACAMAGGVYRGNLTACAPNPCPQPGCTGDTNCDAVVSFADIDPFVEALYGESAWNQAHPNCPWRTADCNHDGRVTFADIDPFVALLGTTCPP
jgi:hypothetical protein